MAAIGFVAAAVALLAGWGWWQPVLVGVTLFSLVLTALDWSNALLAGAVAFSEPLPFTTPVVATAAWLVVFTALAIWRFGREEF